MSFLEIVMFLVAVPGYISDFVQLLNLSISYIRKKRKAKALTQKVSAPKTQENM